MSEDFGSYLKHERELRGVPLDEIAESTKISIRFLRALEESRFEDLPGEVFVKGFIRSYGQAIGSNVDELLAAYDESGSKHQDTETSQIEKSPTQEEQSENHSGFPMTAVLGFGAALLVIAGGIYWFTSGKDENAGKPQPTQLATPSTVDNSLPEIVGEAVSTAIEEASTSPSEAEISNPTSSPAGATEPSQPPVASVDEISTQATGVPSPIKNTVTVPEKDAIIKDLKEQVVSDSTEPSSEITMGDSSLNLVIRVNENSWFNLRIDDQRDQDFILPPDGSKTIQAKNAIVMTIGNRRATQLFLNGQQLDLPESPDNVIRNLTVNAEQLN
jgi:cytoskeleton protein RodZ